MTPICLVAGLYFVLTHTLQSLSVSGGSERLVKIIVRVQCCFTSIETVRTIRDREPRMATSTFTQLLSSVVRVQCCFTSTETVRTVSVRDREPRTATTTFTQLLSSVVRVQCCFTSTETVRTVRDGEPQTPGTGLRHPSFNHCRI